MAVIFTWFSCWDPEVYLSVSCRPLQISPHSWIVYIHCNAYCSIWGQGNDGILETCQPSQTLLLRIYFLFNLLASSVFMFFILSVSLSTNLPRLTEAVLLMVTMPWTLLGWHIPNLELWGSNQGVKMLNTWWWCLHRHRFQDQPHEEPWGYPG